MVGSLSALELVEVVVPCWKAHYGGVRLRSASWMEKETEACEGDLGP